MTDTTPSMLSRDNVFDPLQEFTDARDAGVVTDLPLVYSFTNTRGYVVTGHHDARKVLANSVDFHLGAPDHLAGSGIHAAELVAGNLLALNAEEHTRLRRILVPAFTARRAAAQESRITEIVEAALDHVAEQPQPADLVAHFALPIPMLVLCELLGVPEHDRAEFQTLANATIDLSVSAEQYFDNHREQGCFLRGLVTAARTDPGEDLFGTVIRQHGDDVSDAELVGIGNLLVIAGHETTANMLGLGTLALLRHPDQLNELRSNPDLIGPAVEELMRWLTVVPAAFDRFTTTEVTVGGQTIPAGELVSVYLPTANRDPEFVEDPDRFDISRGTPSHLGFGHGVHRCLGAPLARSEMRIAFSALLRRFPNLALGIPLDEVQYINGVVYGVKSLPVTW